MTSTGNINRAAGSDKLHAFRETHAYSAESGHNLSLPTLLTRFLLYGRVVDLRGDPPLLEPIAGDKAIYQQ